MKKILLAIMAIFLLSLLATADTVYLKNGRVIKTPFAEIVGNKVRFIVAGGEVMFPLSIVERIEQDYFAFPEKKATTAAQPSPTPPEEGIFPIPEEAVIPTGVGDNPEAQKKQADYWVKRRKQLSEELQKAEKGLNEARRRLRTSVDPRDRARTRQEIERLQKDIERYRNELNNLGTEAKKHGILPGELREKTP
jgi:hypothetical protein